MVRSLHAVTSSLLCLLLRNLERFFCWAQFKRPANPPEFCEKDKRREAPTYSTQPNCTTTYWEATHTLTPKTHRHWPRISAHHLKSTSTALRCRASFVGALQFSTISTTTVPKTRKHAHHGRKTFKKQMVVTCGLGHLHRTSICSHISEICCQLETSSIKKKPCLAIFDFKKYSHT